MPSAPARVAEGVDVGGPEVEVCAAAVGKGAGLGADDDADFLDQGVVEGSGRGDGLGELGGGTELVAPGDAPVVGDAVEGFIPPLVGAEAEAGDAGGVAGDSKECQLSHQDESMLRGEQDTRT